MPSSVATPETITPAIRAAAELLLRAHRAGRGDITYSAVPIGDLRACGVTDFDLRGLCRKRLVHNLECWTVPGQDGLGSQIMGGEHLGPSTFLSLTPEGVAWAGAVLVKPHAAVADPNRSVGEVELSSDARADLEKTTPAFSRDDGKWVRNKLAAKFEGVETRTLASYRDRGIATDDGKLGKDRDGRVWRRPGNSSSHPWYLRSTLKSVSQERQRPKSKP